MMIFLLSLVIVIKLEDYFAAFRAADIPHARNWVPFQKHDDFLLSLVIVIKLKDYFAAFRAVHFR